MKKTALQTRLSRDYGDLNVLTGASVRDVVRFEPVGTAHRFQNAHSNLNDGRISQSAIRTGVGALSMGHADPEELGVTEGLEGAFLVAWPIKMPGEIEHTLPRQLEPLVPLVQQIAGHQFSNSPHARDKFGFLTMRFLPVTSRDAKTGQIGSKWHIHMPVSINSASNTLMQESYDRPPIRLRDDQKLSGKLVTSEYFVSNTVPTEVQTQPTDTPLDIDNCANIEYRIKGEGLPTTHFRQASNYEVVQGCSLTYHRAAQVKEDDVGKQRFFALIGYAPTQAVERHI